jgi:aryl-alcohol dehydrogenase-like predicted oxidoreductase
MKQRAIHGRSVGAVGLGCMSFAGFYGATDAEESRACLAAALDLGITHLDTAERYGAGLSEEIIGRFLRETRADVSLATKGGIYVDPERHYDNSETALRRSLEGSLRRLGRERVDLYYVHRRQAAMPIEDVVGVLVRFIEEGKIGAIGFSEIAPASLRRAHAVHPVAAVQSEYSLWTRQPELGMLQTCAELGVTFVAFSPVGRGVFADRFPDPAAFGETDFRRRNPRFTEPNYAANKALIAPFQAFCRARGWSVAAAAVAWTLDQGAHVLPIPGTRSAAHLRDLAAAADIAFTDADRAEIARLLPVGFAHGARYSDAQTFGIERYC